ncbi:aminoglycoside phosphotransferase [Moraxella caviae]|uniref:Aminoglycoside phosphotransferase n=1 Tax=Moraxella caviae TaxID=34060 RepID=A0A1T0A5V7_9GAMM|nr:phosphotransferase [Moraxella caviae]OOR91104.1 aminoglycoside phosphotransferase [Moraxella caviae]STZ14198.1 Predicted phosphotransferase related to Ser/Thr protein kinases [Moraxella caviae]VEW13428.1 Predicted phosphotransferase related to Ser/Thr protein kinases [Moraxella caviae]
MSQVSRHDEMMAFLNAHLSAGFEVQSLAGDASFRRYHRIYFDVKGDEQTERMTYLLMDAPPEKESVVEFLNVADIFSETVNVPDIIARDVARGFLLLQDFGTTEFADTITGDASVREAQYAKALQTLADLQRIRTDVNLPAYSDEKLAQEMDLFAEWFLPYIGVALDDKGSALWQNFKAYIVKAVQAQPKVVVHRDYHSRNLMQDKGSDALGVIDFQDAVIGANTYDLVSLVRDAYVDFDESWVADKIAKFHALIQPEADLHTFTAMVNVMGVQRHLKVLGIFIRLSQRDGKDRYLADIPKVMRDLLAELEWLGEQGDQVCAQFLAWLQASVLPAYQQKFA